MPAWGEEDAHLLPQRRCGPRHCADSGSRGRPCRARAAGARPAVPGSSLQGKCGKRALNSTTSRAPPPPPGSPPQTSQPPPPACRARLPLTLTRARTAPLARSHSSASLPVEPKPGRPELLHQLPTGLQETPCGPARPAAGPRALGSRPRCRRRGRW